MSETLFVKVERVRRLHSARLVEVDVQRGEDGSFGIGLSDENIITNFHHATNAASLQLGDQVCKVDSVALVRERLAHLVQRQFADAQQVRLQVSRVADGGPCKPCEGEVFAVLEVLRSNGEMLVELASDLWTLRTDLVWGAFWTVPMPPATGAVRFCLHRSLIFTEPLLGCVELPLHELTQDNLCTQWHPLRAKGQRGEDILGEVLLSVRRYRAAASVSPAAQVTLGEEEDEDDFFSYESLLNPPQHGAEAIAPVDEPCVAGVRAGFRSLSVSE